MEEDNNVSSIYFMLAVNSHVARQHARAPLSAAKGVVR